MGHNHDWDLTVPAFDFGSGFHQFDCACGATEVLPYGVEPDGFTAPYNEYGTIYPKNEILYGGN